MPVLQHLILARADATADKLTLNQVFLTCAANVDARSMEARRNLTNILMASQTGGGALGNFVDPGRSGERALVQEAGDYPSSCDDNGGLRSVGN